MVIDRNESGSDADAGRRASDSSFLDRDLNWLEFNRRVLHEALDDRTPLLERVKFLAIFTSNLDEFVMKRVYGLREQIRAGVRSAGRTRLGPEVKLRRMRETMLELLGRQGAVWLTTIRPALAKHGIHLLDWVDLAPNERNAARRVFRSKVFPVLTPLAVDPGHPFPFISNLSTSLGIMLGDPEGDGSLFARVKVPQGLPQWLPLCTPGSAGEQRYIHLTDLIAHNLDPLFPGMQILDVLPFRVTRNAEVGAGDINDAEDLLEAIEDKVRQRRLECAVRLEHPPAPNPEILRLLMQQLDLRPEDVYEMPGPLEYLSLSQIASLQIPGLRYEHWTPAVPPALADAETSIFDVIRAGDLLVHHPYDSFDGTALRFIRQAVEDPDVLAIKITLYRTGSDSPFIPLLIQAAEAGKQVVCLVELKARFDEQQNIELARQMERAGVHVIYGFERLKTHTKTALVVRREGDDVRCYAHAGTGNYHYKTARLYVDLGLLTANDGLTGDVAHLFNYLTGRCRDSRYQKLLVAPVDMKRRFIEMIDREAEHHRAGRPARIVAKMNQLEDRQVIRALYRASRAGVPIDLVVRGFCTARPGVPGLSDNIRVCSVIGRFLEHSRIYCFRNGHDDELEGDYFIGSADWMHRNLDARVEAVAPIEDRSLRRELWDILQVHLTDQRSAWDMQPDGTYVQRRPALDTTGPETKGSHQVLMERTRQRGR
jgi:polyphosphate kinase